MTILDKGGLHKFRVYHCCCAESADRPFAEQLLQIGLFPYSDLQPKTAVTIEALRDFEKHQLCGKETIWDYFEVIRRKTDNIRPQSVPVRRFVLRVIV